MVTKQPEKEVAAKKKRNTAVRSKRPKDYPRRPLSAYNIYFREERAKLLAAGRALGAGEKIGFEKLAKTIGKRWKELSEEQLERFKKLANEDTERYRREMDAYHLDLAMKGRKEREEMARKRQEEAGVGIGIGMNNLQQHNVGLTSSRGGFSTTSAMGLPPPPSAATSTEPKMGVIAVGHLLGRIEGDRTSAPC